MKRSKVEQVVLDAVREQLEMEQVPLAAHFFDELGGDSLDYAEVAMAIEDHFDITLPDERHPSRIFEIAELVGEAIGQKEAKGLPHTSGTWPDKTVDVA